MIEFLIVLNLELDEAGGCILCKEIIPSTPEVFVKI